MAVHEYQQIRIKKRKNYFPIYTFYTWTYKREMRWKERRFDGGLHIQ